jgi:hypothetical protein
VYLGEVFVAIAHYFVPLYCSVKTDKESAPPKRGRVQRGENLKENTTSLPIDVFFSKA